MGAEKFRQLPRRPHGERAAPPARCCRRGLPPGPGTRRGAAAPGSRRPQREPRSAASTERPGRAAARPPLPLRWSGGGLRGRPLTPPQRPPRARRRRLRALRLPTAAGSGALGAPHGAAPRVGAEGRAAGPREEPRTCGTCASRRSVLRHKVRFYCKRRVSGPRISLKFHVFTPTP